VLGVDGHKRELRDAAFLTIDHTRQTRELLQKSLNQCIALTKSGQWTGGYHDDREGPRHHGLRYRPPALRTSISFHHRRARAGTTAALNSPPARCRRACSLRGRGAASSLLLMFLFVPLRVEVSRFVRQSRRDTQMTSMDVDRWTRVKDRLRAEVGDDVYAS